MLNEAPAIQRSQRFTAGAGVALLIGLLCTVPVYANENAPSVDLVDDSQFEVSITPGVWLPRLGGQIELDAGSLARPIDFEDELDLNALEPTFEGELTLRSKPGRDGWNVHLSGFSFDTSNTGRFEGTTAAAFGSLTLNPDDPYHASFDFESYAAEFGFITIPLVDTLDGNHGSTDPNGHAQTTLLRVTPHIGARYVDVRHEITLTGATPLTERASGHWLAAYGGATVTMQFDPPPAIPVIQRVHLSGTYSFGPAIHGGTGTIWQVRGEMGLNFTPNAGLVFGYRLVELDLEDDDFEVDGGLQGLFIAGRVTF